MKVTTDGCLFGAWVASQIMEMKQEPKRILDIGTGTGLLSLMLAQVTQKTLIDALEINRNAYQQAQENFERSNWHDRIRAIYQPLQTWLVPYKYDLIICNPPFFDRNLKGHNQNRNQAIHSDHLPMGDLIVGIGNLKSKEGCAYVMYPETEMNRFIDEAARFELHCESEMVIRNRKNSPVFRKVVNLATQSSNPKSLEIIIRENSGYTPIFSRLLDSYYL